MIRMFLLALAVFALAGCDDNRARIRCAHRSVAGAWRILEQYHSDRPDVPLETVDVNDLLAAGEYSIDYPNLFKPGSCLGDPFAPRGEQLCTVIIENAKDDGFTEFRAGKLRLIKVSEGVVVTSRGPSRQYTIPDRDFAGAPLTDLRAYAYDPTNGISSAGDFMAIIRTGNPAPPAP